MNEILERLYEGAINPIEEPVSRRYIAIMQQVSLYHETLIALLDKEGADCLEEYRDVLADLETCAAKDSFQKGVRIGARLALAVWEEK